MYLKRMQWSWEFVTLELKCCRQIQPQCFTKLWDISDFCTTRFRFCAPLTFNACPLRHPTSNLYVPKPISVNLSVCFFFFFFSSFIIRKTVPIFFILLLIYRRSRTVDAGPTTLGVPHGLSGLNWTKLKSPGWRPTKHKCDCTEYYTLTSW